MAKAAAKKKATPAKGKKAGATGRRSRPGSTKSPAATEAQKAAQKAKAEADATAKAAKQAADKAARDAEKAKKKADQEAQKAKQEAEAKGKQTTALRNLEPKARTIKARWDKAAKADANADDHRLAAALEMKAAQDMCKEAKINWREWAEANLPVGWETTRKMVKIASSDDPKAAIADMRAATAQANARLRAKRASEGAKAVSGPKGNVDPAKADAKMTPIKATEAAFASVTEAGQRSFVETQAKNMGKVLVDPETAKAARKVADAAPEDRAKDAFKALTPDQRMTFLEWAAEEVGATVDIPDFDAPKGEDDLEPPAFLKKGKGKK